MFGLLRVKTIGGPETVGGGISPYSRFGPDDARRAPDQTHTRFDTKHIRRATAQKIAREEETQPVEAEPFFAVDDLHSDAPITVGVLRRALPGRFAVKD